MAVTINLPAREPDEVEESYVDRCREFMFKELEKHGINAANIWPTSIGGMDVGPDTITMNVDCSYIQNFENKNEQKT
jgi:hypothetical protein